MKILLFIIVPYLLFSSTYYVDKTNGNDLNSGLATETAWRSLNKVNISNFSPGDSILFKRGNVWWGQLQIKSFSGSIGQMIIYSAYSNGKNPVIVGWDYSFPVVLLKDQSFITIENITFSGGKQAISIEALEHNIENIIIDSCILKRAFNNGIMIVSWTGYLITNGTIKNNIIDNCGKDGINFWKGVNHWEVYNNTISDNTHTAISIGSDNTDSPTSYNDIFNNRISGLNTEYMRGFSTYGTDIACQYNEFHHNVIQNTTVRNQIGGNNNLIYNNIIDIVENSDIGASVTGQAISLEGQGGGVGVSHHNKIFNNILINIEDEPIREIGSNVYNNSIFDNVILDIGYKKN